MLPVEPQHRRAFSARVPARLGRPVVVTRIGGRRRVDILCGESRIGKKPVPIPKGVSYTLEGRYLKVKVIDHCPLAMAGAWTCTHACACVVLLLWQAQV